jgi:phosphatidylserine decarboxylase
MIAREGWLPILLCSSAVVFTALTVGPVWAAPVCVLVLGLVALFRETSRVVPSVPLAIVSPIDAMVLFVGPVHDPWLKRDAIVIRLRVPFPGITALLSPTEGKVMDFFTNFGAADVPTNSPTAYALWIRTDEHDDVAVCIATRRHSRFKAQSAPGERVGHGHRNGFVYFATEVAVYLPPNTHSQVTPGERVRAGSSIVATLVRRETP